jgi:tetratricopeptide (TPR) repeat protein
VTFWALVSRMSTKILRAYAASAVVSLVASGLGFPTCATAQSNSSSPRQTVVSPVPSSAAAPILEVYNFALAAGAESPEQIQTLQQAVPDSLFLRFLGDPRIEVRRIRQGYTFADARAADSRHKEAAPRYVLDGKIAFMQAGVAASASGGHQAAPGFVVISYSLRELGHESSGKPLIDNDETTTFAQLPGTLRRVSGHVITTLLPPSKITLQVGAPQFKDLPSARQAFYSQNLPDLLVTELSRQGWIDLVEQEKQGDYLVSETLQMEKDKKAYMLQATISRRGAPVGPPLVETARDTEVLAAQLRLAGQIIDALKISVALAPTGSGPVAQPSSDDYLKAAAAYEKTDPDLSISLYKRALERDPSNRQAKIALAFAYIKKNQADEALKILQASEFEDSAQGQYLRSLAYHHADDHVAALHAADRAVQLQPDYDICYFWRGYLYELGKDYPNAVRDFEAARKLNPKDPDYYEYSARVQEKLGGYDQAIAVLEAGRVQTGEGPRFAATLNETRRRAAAHFLDAGNPAEGLRFALASVNDDKNSEWGQRLVGIAYHRLGKASEAEQSLQRALNIQKTEQSYSELAYLRLEQGKKNDAFGLAEKAIEIDSDAATPYGVFERGVSDPAEAKEVIDWLKVYAAKNPPARNALIDWDYFQLQFRPNDSSEVDELYSAYVDATKSVPYRDWLDGWSNLVELALIQGKYDDASAIAGELLKTTPKIEYLTNLLFYRWAAQLLQRDCGASQNSLQAFTDFLAGSQVNGFENSWVFQATRSYLDSQATHGALDPDTHALVQAALDLLESKPINRPKVDGFLTKVRASRRVPCPAATRAVASR